MKKDDLIKALSSIFVAVIFLGSYVSLNNNNALAGVQSTSQNTTPQNAPATVYATGTGNAIVLGYVSPVTLIACNSTALPKISEDLSGLQSQSIVNNFFQSNSTSYLAYMAQSSNIMSSIGNITSGDSCIRAYSKATLMLPQSVVVTVNGVKSSIPIPEGKRNYILTLPIANVTNYTVKINMLLTYNYSIYGNLSVKLA